MVLLVCSGFEFKARRTVQLIYVSIVQTKFNIIILIKFSRYCLHFGLIYYILTFLKLSKTRQKSQVRV